MNTKKTPNWNSANQRYLMAAIKVLQEELETSAIYTGKIDEDNRPTSIAQEEMENAIQELSDPAALETLVTVLGLTSFERKLLLLCAGVELDAQFSEGIGTLQGDPFLANPTFSLALAAFSDAHWDAIAPGSPLRYWHLIDISTDKGLNKSPLKINEHILHYLTGVRYLDKQLEVILEPVYAQNSIVPSQMELVKAILFACSAEAGYTRLPALQFSGDRADKLNIAALACAEMGLQLYNLSAFSIPGNYKEMEELIRLLNRDTALNSFALYLDCTQLDTADKLRVQLVTHFIEKMESVLMVDTEQWILDLKREKIDINVLRPTLDEQKQLWEKCLGNNNQIGLSDKIVAHFDLSAKTIDLAGRETAVQLAQNKIQEGGITELEKTIWKACCKHTRPKVEELAQRIEPMAGWNDIVLPETSRQMLKEIAMQVKNRYKVYQEWGFAGASSRGLGIAALFAGESGTGKTMASEVLANELNLDLYRIDLSQVVNKYIGETEKNLKRIFDAAEEGGAILLFDEADALFGKRSEVKDSHDRYSNIEVSYLLQRMEAYRGLAILTTNMKGALDKAFLRRIRFVVPFPFPDAMLRADIWNRIFPAGTPVTDLNVDKLSRLNIPGGNIRNIALNAAFMAAEEGQSVQMTHLSRAVRTEYAKIEKALSNSEIGGW
ncbi:MULTISPECIES: ATP-binding protein [Niastella]|uniref:ATP-binding protein n=1 Tax=Niastella soli TaxID=2821487 RepID=A0ABS3Z732_9BACT|nr:AAA family ATPase [Niastella soli]MBO9205495.1 ATP-binding protein [Niastella soli]